MDIKTLRTAQQVDRDITRLEDIMCAIRYNGVVIHANGIGYPIRDIFTNAETVKRITGIVVSELKCELENQRELFAKL